MKRLAGSFLVLALAGAGAAGCRRGAAGSDQPPTAAAPPGPAGGPPAPAAEPRLADLTGAYANVLTLTLAQRTDGGQIAGSDEYAVTMAGPGTLVYAGSRFSAASCSGAFGDQRLVLRELDANGTTVAVTPLAAHVPLHFVTAKRFALEVFATAAAACAAGSPVQLAFALHFFPEGSAPDAPLLPAPVVATRPPGPDPASPAGPPAPPPGPTPRPGPLPSPVPPGPVPPVPTPCPTLAGEPDAALPQPLRATIVLNATLSERDGCREVARWRVADVVSRPSGDGCPAPVVTVALASQASDNRLLKITETHADFNTELAWILAPDPATAAQLVHKLQAGETVALAPANDACAASPAAPVVLDNPDDWLLFRGDPREACAASGEPAPLTAATLTEVLGGAGQPAGLAVSYRYGGAADFDWTLSYAFATTPAVSQLVASAAGKALELGLYDRRAHAFLGPWTPLALDGFPAGAVTVSDPAVLARLLPSQADVEVVVRAPLATGCHQRLVYPYDHSFLDPARTPAFKDLTNPGRSRYLLKEADLPH